MPPVRVLRTNFRGPHGPTTTQHVCDPSGDFGSARTGLAASRIASMRSGPTASIRPADIPCRTNAIDCPPFSFRGHTSGPSHNLLIDAEQKRLNYGWQRVAPGRCLTPDDAGATRSTTNPWTRKSRQRSATATGGQPAGASFRQHPSPCVNNPPGPDALRITGSNDSRHRSR